MQEEGEHLLEPCSSSSFTWMCAGGSGVQLGAPRSRQCRRAVRPPSQHGHCSAPGARHPSLWHLQHPTWCQECSWWGWRCWLLLAPAWGRAASAAQPRGVSWCGCVAASRQRCLPWSAAERLRSDLSREEVCLGGAGGASSAEIWGSGAPRGRAGVMGRKGRTGVGGRGGRRGRGKVGGEGGERSEESGARGGERRKTGWGEERHTHRDREFCNNLNSFQTMSKEPWQHGLKQTLPLIL